MPNGPAALRLSVLMLCCLVAITASADEPAQAPAAAEPLTVDAARRQARILHRVYSATLDAMHHYYFHANKAVIPARAMEDIFADAAAETQATSRWISVNTRAMGVDHEPESEFEKSAAAALSKGDTQFELIENGVYRRAGAIPLTAGCIGCHVGATAQPTKIPRVAGLVISIPVRQD